MKFHPASFFSSFSRTSFKNSDRYRLVLLVLVLMLVVSACSRQADGPFEPVDGSTPTTAPTAVSQIMDATTETDEIGDTGQMTPTFAPLPTEESDNPGDLDGLDDPAGGTEDDAADAPLIFTLAPSTTPTPDPNDNGIIDPLATEDVTETIEGQFITPGVPSGPIDRTGAGGTGGTPGTPGTGANDLLPTPTDMVDFSGTPATEVDEECIYVVQRGDSLFGIALKLEIRLADLRAVNPEVRDTDFIQINQELIIPDCGDNVVPDEDETEDEIGTPAGATATVQPQTGRTHQVAAGETLVIISRRYGVTIDAIVRANSLANPNRLSVGQMLIIPDGD